MQLTASRLARLPGTRAFKAARATAALAPEAAWGFFISGKPLSKAFVNWHRHTYQRALGLDQGTRA
eukprot:4107084-Alexandrium_andersonii.AAC.1